MVLQPWVHSRLKVTKLVTRRGGIFATRSKVANPCPLGQCLSACPIPFLDLPPVRGYRALNMALSRGLRTDCRQQNVRGHCIGPSWRFHFFLQPDIAGNDNRTANRPIPARFGCRFTEVLRDTFRGPRPTALVARPHPLRSDRWRHPHAKHLLDQCRTRHSQSARCQPVVTPGHPRNSRKQAGPAAPPVWLLPPKDQNPQVFRSISLQNAPRLPFSNVRYSY